ncbi:MAG: hypothetical protein J6K86_05580 [Clostridia bacterium]|nr:hypothetical protein [Clostridia bacterium]
MRKRARENASLTPYFRIGVSPLPTAKNDASLEKDKEGADFPTGVYCA